MSPVHQCSAWNLRCSIWTDIPTYQRRRRRCVMHWVLTTLNVLSAKQLWLSWLLRQCPQDIVSQHGCTLWSCHALVTRCEHAIIQTKVETLHCFRFLNNKLTKHFENKGMFFRASYVTAVRDWSGNLENYTTTFGAYKKRAKDQKEVPHSFTFVRRDCF